MKRIWWHLEIVEEQPKVDQIGAVGGLETLVSSSIAICISRTGCSFQGEPSKTEQEGVRKLG